MRKNDATHDIPADHVVLTFGFDTAVTLTSIELDLFYCPEWNIGVPFISVYADGKNSLVFSSSSDFIRQKTPRQTSCDSLSTIVISFEELITSPTWHIVVSFAAQPDTEWVHVGEVRLLGTDSTPASMCTTKEPILSLSEYILSLLHVAHIFFVKFYSTFFKVRQLQEFLVPVPPRVSRMI